MSMELTIGSLFAGIGGLELGLERAIPGARTIWQVEQDPYARRVLAKHWPQANRSVTDVREAGAHNLERPDILCGGFPCQDISNAGKCAGLVGDQSILWFEFARIIGELRPRYAVLENVAAIRSRGLGTVLGGLAAIGYDAFWDCIPAAAIGAPHRRDRWFCVAYANGAKLWKQSGRSRGQDGQGSILAPFNGQEEQVADADSGRLQGKREPQHGEQQGPRGDQSDGCSPWRRGQGTDLAHADSRDRQTKGNGPRGRNASEEWKADKPGGGSKVSRTAMAHAMRDGLEDWIQCRGPGSPIGEAGEAAAGHGGNWWAIEPSVGRGPDGLPAGLHGSGVAVWERGISRTVQGKVPDRVSRLRCLGNAVVPQVAEILGRVICELERTR